MPESPARFDIHQDGVVGTVFLPPSTARAPLRPVLFLSGSAGGLPTRWPKALAEEGFTVFGLAYFGLEGLPPTLAEVRLEYFETAMAVFQSSVGFARRNLQLVGLSRGGELALLLATRHPELAGIVSVSGSGLVHRSPPHHGPMRSSWSEDGVPLPFLEQDNRCDDPSLWISVDGRPVSPRERYLLNLRDQAAVQRAMIPLERINAPALLISGGDDRCWPAATLMEHALQRMSRAGNRHLATHHVFPQAGHTISGPFHTHSPADCCYTVAGTEYLHGGTPHDNAAASEIAWKLVIGFLGRQAAAHRCSR